ncbi:MAG: FAD-dependent monooxygenase [Treponema sp.]|nr:FAD-dependent monooxygenase [Treponema sp.]
MTTELSIIIPPEKEKDGGFIRQEICRALSRKGIHAAAGDISTVFLKKSVDARHGKLKLVLRYKIYIGETPAEDTGSTLPEWKHADGSRSVVIVGSGPAGLFGALRLLEHGIRPVIIERGEDCPARKRDIAAISTKGIVGEDSNYCFGAGGAGTFSDGKLYTRSTKRGDSDGILRILVHFGADPAILTDAHPHIGTDRLPGIITRIKDHIVALGGEVHFNTRCTQFITERTADGTPRLLGIRTEHTKSGEQQDFFADAVLLATGHSAPDIYRLVARTAPQALEAKTFAAGVRVEHPRELIDSIQYHGRREQAGLGAAEYRLTSQQEERGVYSFCMCPGGFVVPSASAPGQLVVNGMSAAGRNSRWSNAAIVVETRPEDIPEEFRRQAQQEGCPALAGLLWRTQLEQLAFSHGEGQKAPAQRLEDFLAQRESSSLPPTSYTPGITASRLDEWLPQQMSTRLAAGFRSFGRSMNGFISRDALLIAAETRTSTPVRILRNKESWECTAIRHLYPAGEGAGYAGGIMSSAMDGQNACTAIAAAI